MADVFISYKREDRPAAMRIANAISRQGYSVWFDAELTSGSGWIAEVDKQVRTARCVIVCWSSAALKSDSVLGEAKIAAERGVLTPVFIEDGLKLPPPFNMLHTEGLSHWSGEDSDPAIRRLVDRVGAKVAIGGSLGEAMLAARRAREGKLVAVFAMLESAARDLALDEIKAAIETTRKRLGESLFKLFVVGRMKTGKSTVINALLGRAEGLDKSITEEGPLPVNDLPCTAVLTRLRYAQNPYVEALPKDVKQKREKWSFKDYHRRARIRDENGKKNEELFDKIAEFEVGWPTELLRSGVSIVDSPGVSERPERTAYTKAEVQHADAAIVVYRSEPFAGEDEIEFDRHVTQFAPRRFVLVNMRDGRKLDPGLAGEARDKLGIPDNVSFEQAGVYFVDNLAGLRGRLRGDEQTVEASGLRAFEQRLARFLIDERYDAQIRTVLADTARHAGTLLDKIETQHAALTADKKKVDVELKACRKLLDEVAHRRKRIGDVIDGAQREAKSAAVLSFQNMVYSTADNLHGMIAEERIEGLQGFWATLGAATLQGEKFAKRAVDLLNSAVRRSAETWSTNPPDKPGLAQDLAPTFERLGDNLRHEAQEIDEKLKEVRLRLTSLSVSADVASGRSPIEFVAAHVIGVAVFGPLGSALATGGMRAVVGGVAGLAIGAIVAKIAVVVVAAAFHVVLAPAIVVGLIWATVVGGGVAAAAEGIEERLKAKAVEKYTPTLREMASARKHLSTVEASVAEWFFHAKSRVDAELGKLIESERENLSRIEALSSDQRRRESNLEMLTHVRQTVTEASAATKAIEVSLSAAS
ncbi:MAG: TIR domain-containing protein [Phycisphaerales bacterium]|nr:TIR domain-containing protein [Hyphomonadaceae bacterium]